MAQLPLVRRMTTLSMIRGGVIGVAAVAARSSGRCTVDRVRNYHGLHYWWLKTVPRLARRHPRPGWRTGVDLCARRSFPAALRRVSHDISVRRSCAADAQCTGSGQWWWLLALFRAANARRVLRVGCHPPGQAMNSPSICVTRRPARAL